MKILGYIIRKNFVNDFFILSELEIINNFIPNLYLGVFALIVHFKIDLIDNEIFKIKRSSINIISLYDGLRWI